MDASCQSSELDAKYLLGQLNIARKEINNLRQQIKSLRYIHEKDVDSIKRLLGLCSHDSVLDSTVSKVVQPSTSNCTDDTLKLKPVGVITSWFPSKRGTPRQPGICGKAPGKLTLFNSVFTNPEHALQGLQDFSHMWILFHFHRNDSTHVRAKVAPPRLNGVRMGVYSTRSPHRPCPIGLSLVKIVKIENYTIYFEGVDMVDQTPVLDIKPYIPQYDNPMYIEKFNSVQPEHDSNDSDTVENISQKIREGTDTNRRLNLCNVAFDCNEESRNLLQESHYADRPDEATQISTDVSRDEEIALRLQAEEFEGSSNFTSYGESRNYFRVSDINFENASSFEDGTYMQFPSRTSDVLRDRSNGLNSELNTLNRQDNVTSESIQLPNLRQNSVTSVSDSRNGLYVSRNLESQSENRDALQNIHLSIHDPRDITSTLRSSESNYMEDQMSRNSRLLDGADGPSTVCGTDLDLIHRRIINTRLDNSPIRMGIREAPDGEEGLASQNLTPSQIISNTQSVTSSSNSNTSEGAVTTFNSERSAQNSRGETNYLPEVRIPDWISRPRLSTLSVVFNDRALIQLSEILKDKSDDEKRAIESVLREDPRSVYLRQRWGNQFYTFLIHDLHISCRFDDNRGVVTVFQVRHAGRTCECGEPEWQCLGHSPLS